MNFLLKIVEGPNRGAEIALVEGVPVTVGKGDGCDIVLADATLPDAPLRLEPGPGGVTIDGEPMEAFHVKTLGATSFAVGPSDAPWGELVWQKAGGDERVEGKDEEAPAPPPAESAAEPEEADREDSPKRRRGCFGCLIALLFALLLLAVLAWLFRDRMRECDWAGIFGAAGASGASAEPAEKAPASLASVAAKYGLSVTNTSSGAGLVGNLGTRRDRLAATAEAYQAEPGSILDITDDESFRVAGEDALFTLTEGALKVVAATNRVLSIAGTSPSPAALKRTLEALNADMPKLRNVDVSGVVLRGDAASASDDSAESPSAPAGAEKARRSRRRSPPPSFPVCGILTSPYPCLVMRDGRRVMEGAPIGDGVVLKIDADSVVVTNSAGRFTWKP